MSENKLLRKILTFMTVIYECYSNTNFAEDRSIYAQDLTEAMGWVVDLLNKKKVEFVVANIKSLETEKYFTDYWRQGKWGEKENTAFASLKRDL